MSMSRNADSAAQYSHGHQPSVLASHATRTAANSCAYFLDRVRPGVRLLDLGCGPGSITLDLAERVGHVGYVLGIDSAAAAIEAATATAAQRGDQRTRFAVGDLSDLNVEPGSFDIVHAHQVLQHVPDPVAALKAMARYCAPGGIIAVRDADYGAMAWYPPSDGLQRWHTIYCTGARNAGAEPDAGRRLRAWAQDAGLRVASATSSTWTYATTDSTRWWGNSQAERVRNSTFTRRAADLGLTAEQIEQIAVSWQEWGQDPQAWFFLPHGELLASPSSA
ncbi:class I SAM-dependent methyltransferase [Gephyromycinifex aptenodytis]|uniref:class I SAM-dependent methyltransferase n=1 Tax=Gephyromycinifex aptenodytis TaxID=2716227 RepID=UPI001B2FED07|nr:methyltransferase domain-containing protein [Gephyromycinifex aptenodytis]